MIRRSKSLGKKHAAFWFAAVTVLAATQTFATVTAIDALQRTVVLDQPAQRLVTLAPYLAELAFASGSGDLVVGTVEYSDYPITAQRIPRIGNSNLINYEAVIALQPDLVLVWQTGNGVDVMEKLVALQLPFYVSEPGELDDIANELVQIGQLTGRLTEGKRSADNFTTELENLRGQFQNRERISVFYELWHEPMQTLNRNHIVSDVIQLCGGQNIFAAAKAIAPVVGIEAILAANPQAIIVSGIGMEKPDWMSTWQNWPTLQAVRKQHIYFVPADLLQRHTPRILEGARQLCDNLEAVRKQ